MKKNKIVKLHHLFFSLLMCFVFADVSAKPRIAVLDFELKDMTLAPRIPAEIIRTASIKPLMESELKKSGFDMVYVNPDVQQFATAGTGYLFDHPDVAAQLGKEFNADYVIVGRLHKPSFLFFYLMAHLVDVKTEAMAGEYLYEVKGSEKKIVVQGVEGITEKIIKTLGTTK